MIASLRKWSTAFGPYNDSNCLKNATNRSPSLAWNRDVEIASICSIEYSDIVHPKAGIVGELIEADATDGEGVGITEDGVRIWDESS